MRSLLAVLAHPDDETFRCGGTLALLARQGVRVQVLSATRGQAGSCGDPPLCRPDELGQIREGELRCACRALGLESPILLDYQDGVLDQVSETEAVSRITAVIQKLRPQILLIWPPDGLSGHPDHVAVSRWTGLAFQQTAVPGPVAPVAIYHPVMPGSLAQRLGLTHLRTVSETDVSLTVDVTPVWAQKLAAINCHRTQLGATPILAASEEKQRLFLGTEYFRLAGDRAELTAWLDRESLQKTA